ncbi:MAG: hypothetical protein JO296_18250 [Pseudonocardiales bacterium]|nr:hypothetical protein [Pseudonocardiales bacterium]
MQHCGAHKSAAFNQLLKDTAALPHHRPTESHSVGLVHAQLLRSVVRAHFDDPAELAQIWHQHTEQHVAPYYWNQVAADRARIAEITALRDGRPPPERNSVMDRFVKAVAGTRWSFVRYSKLCCAWRCHTKCSNAPA